MAKGGGYPEGYPELIRDSLPMFIRVLIREDIREGPAARRRRWLGGGGLAAAAPRSRLGGRRLSGGGGLATAAPRSRLGGWAAGGSAAAAVSIVIFPGVSGELIRDYPWPYPEVIQLIPRGYPADSPPSALLAGLEPSDR